MPFIILIKQIPKTFYLIDHTVLLTTTLRAIFTQKSELMRRIHTLASPILTVD